MKRKSLWMLLVLPFILGGCGNTPTSSDTSAKTSSSTKTSEKTSSETTSSTVDNTTSSSTDPSDDTYTIEAEYTNLTGKKGNGYSGGANGKEMVQQDTEDTNAGASNGYWVGYLYSTDISLDFVFTSTTAATDVTLKLRVTCEVKDITLTSDNYTIEVNGEKLTDYGTITLAGASTSDSSGYVRPFSNFTSRKKINLVEGENTIRLITTNADGMGGTMYATAPMVDCIMLSNLSGSTLDYTKITDNLSLFEE